MQFKRRAKNQRVFKIMKTTRIVIVLCFLGFCTQQTHAQHVAIKTNALGWLTASPNIGGEFLLSPHLTLNIELAFNPLKTNSLQTTFVHAQPELRYWFGRPMDGHFIGGTAFMNFYNLKFSNTYYKGDAFAAGVTYGYAWILNNYWNIEATIGLGCIKYRQCKYKEGGSKPQMPNSKDWTPAPVKLGVSFVYIIH